MTAQTDLNKIKTIVKNTDEHRNRARRDSWEQIKEILFPSDTSEPEPEPEAEPVPAAAQPAAPAPSAETPATPATGT